MHDVNSAGFNTDHASEASTPGMALTLAPNLFLANVTDRERHIDSAMPLCAGDAQDKTPPKMTCTSLFSPLNDR
jgi:hypothetical protein